MEREIEHCDKVMSQSSMDACPKSGPGYASPLAAISGPRETLLYVTAIYSGNKNNLLCRYMSEKANSASLEE